MVERQEVEALLAEVHSMAEINQVAVGDIAHPVSGDTLAALCRAWLALEEAQVRNVVGGQWDDVFAREGNVVWCSDLHPGQRVRIVKEPGE